MAKEFFVYILSSKSRVIYVGVTSDLIKRLYEHKSKVVEGFTKQYRVDRLVYFESCCDAVAAIAREKRIKGWTRARKAALIEERNPAWDDLSAKWGRKA